ncbi:hypothetical protein EVG20_g11564 [Dentipellis fragilis]|uniref:Uncharacterized protein n=1 Tax=Dentipellis fragilis TaxID=205917 RepID=A0A4Y9XK93_9AGAM|nr:hypothetical protein EVG20_g11564 [Dentipellis fragilis]
MSTPSTLALHVCAFDAIALPSAPLRAWCQYLLICPHCASTVLRALAPVHPRYTLASVHWPHARPPTLALLHASRCRVLIAGTHHRALCARVLVRGPSLYLINCVANNLSYLLCNVYIILVFVHL